MRSPTAAVARLFSLPHDFVFRESLRAVDGKQALATEIPPDEPGRDEPHPEIQRFERIIGPCVAQAYQGEADDTAKHPYSTVPYRSRNERG